MTATLAENAATQELVSLLQGGGIGLTMVNYGDFEKVGSLHHEFTTSDSLITTQPGDIMLYQGTDMVIFYGSNTWNYTPLGKIDGATAENVRQFVGISPAGVTIFLYDAAIEEASADEVKSGKVYDLNGRLVTSRPLTKGVYVINGAKKIVK